MSSRSARELIEPTGHFPYPSVFESRQESPSNCSSPIGRWEYAMSHEPNNTLTPGQRWTDASSGRTSHNIWSSDTAYSSNAYYRGGNDGDSLYTSSSYAGTPNQNSSSKHDESRGMVVSNEQLDTFDVTSAMDRLCMQPQQSHFYYADAITSIPSMASASGASQTAPSIVGVSSGSTGGSTTRSTSTWNDQSAGKSRPLSYPKQPFYPEALRYSASDFAMQTSLHDTSSTSCVHEEDSVEIRPDKHQAQGYRRNQKKGRPNWRNNNNNKSGQHKTGRGRGREDSYRDGADDSKASVPALSDDYTAASSQASSEAIRMLMSAPVSTSASLSSSQASGLTGSRLPLDCLVQSTPKIQNTVGRPILPAIEDAYHTPYGEDDVDEAQEGLDSLGDEGDNLSPTSKKKEWLVRMNRRMNEIPIGQLDPSSIPIAAIMNAWAKTKSAQGASMVEMWLKRIKEEVDAGNASVVLNTKLYTMAGKSIAIFSACYFAIVSHIFKLQVDAWAKSGEGVIAAQRAEAILQNMHDLYQSTGKENLRPTTGIFNAVINAWARSKEKAAPSRAEQILQWMDNLHRSNPTIQVRPDKFTYNTGKSTLHLLLVQVQHALTLILREQLSMLMPNLVELLQLQKLKSC